MKWLYAGIVFIGMLFAISVMVQAAPAANLFTNILPVANNTYDFGSTSPLATWKNVFTQNASTTNLTVSGLGGATGCLSPSANGSITTTACSGGGASGLATTSLAATWPITLVTSSAAATYGFNGLSTSSAAVISNIPYFSGVNTFANVATSSETCTYPVSCGAHAVLTGGGAITFSGLATTSTWSAGNLAEVSSNNTVFGVATTSIGCSGFLTCTGFNALGSASTITTTGSLSVGSGGTGTNTFGQGWLSTAGGTNAFTASTSPTVNYITATSTTATSSFAFSINAGSGGVATNNTYLTRFATVYSTSTPGTNASVVFTGSRDSAPSFSAGTLTLPSNTASLSIEIWGGGGGSSGSTDGSHADATGGTGGGTSCFGTNATACTSPLLQATGGGGALAPDFGSTGGVGGIGSLGDFNLTGGGGFSTIFGFAINFLPGYNGGGGPRGAEGAGGNFATGTPGGAFGGGAAGGGCNNTCNQPGPGGGGGGYSKKVITSPSGTYHYTIGAGGSGGNGGVNGSAGAAGGSGGLIITIYTY